MIRTRVRFLAIVAVAALALAGCTARISAGAPFTPLRPGQPHAPVTVSMWDWQTGPEAAAAQKILDNLHRDYPWLTVNLVQGKDDFSVLQGIYSGAPPDIAVLAGPDNVAKFCSSNAMPDLGAIAKKDGIDLAALIPPQVLKTATYQGKTCVLPWLTDAFALYYNKTMLRNAGFDHPPRSLAELETMGKKLTTYNKDGSIKVAGFVPLSSFYHSNIVDDGPTFGADWYQPNGKSAFATDPRWQQGLSWQKQYIDSVGLAKLQKFAAQNSADTEYTPNNAFETGKVAMAMDGEWRVGYLDKESKVDYATAPFPTLDPANYGSGRIGGTMISMPSSATDPAVSWLVLKYLALNTGPLNQAADSLQNVPTTYASLRTSKYANRPINKTFVDILRNPKSAWKQPTIAGQVDMDLLGSFVQKFESGGVPDLHQGLQGLASDIDGQISVR